MLALRLPEDIESRLDKLAKATGRTKSFYAREAILEHLADLEDLYLAESYSFFEPDCKASKIHAVWVKPSRAQYLATSGNTDGTEYQGANSDFDLS